MIIYRFKFDNETAQSGETSKLINFILSVCPNDNFVNFLPSKRDIIFKVEHPGDVQVKLINFIKENVRYNFEFETHSEEHRTLTQVKQESIGPVITVCYLLPLFSLESYLNL